MTKSKKPKPFARMAGGPDKPLDTTPVEMPLGASRPLPLQDIIARMVRDAVQQEQGEEFESWEDSDDFEEEDPDVLDMSPYTFQDLQDETPISAMEPPQEGDNPPPQEAPQEMTGDQPDPNATEPDNAS